MIIENKNLIISGIGKGIGRDMFIKSLEISRFTIGIVRDKKDFQSINTFVKKKNKTNFKLFLGDIKNQFLIDNILKYLYKNKILINGLINNSGERQRKKFLQITNRDLKKIFENNFFSHFYFIQKLIKYFKKNRNGIFSIVNVGSIVGVNGFAQLSGYAATKSALEALTKCLASEFANENIKVNIIHPGFIKTSYFKNFKKNKKKLYNWTLSRIPQKRWGDPADVTNLAMFLISDKSNYINGQSIVCDGGWVSS